MNNSVEEIIALLNAPHSNNNQEILDILIPFVYKELRAQAHRHLRGERSNHTLQTSALINEVYLRLVEQKNVKWQNRAHFLGLAANMMRRILIDYAKNRQRAKRGGKDENLSLEAALSVEIETADEATKIDIILLDEALNKLAKKGEREARIVELRFFSGLTVEETAEVLGVSTMTVKRDWNVAKAWLKREMNPKINLEGK